MSDVIKAIFLFFVSGAAFAGGSVGLVTQFLSNADGAVMFIAGTHESKPSCSTEGESWILNGNTVGGRNMLSTILSAQAQKKSIRVIGTGNCTYWGDRENVAGIVIID